MEGQGGSLGCRLINPEQREEERKYHQAEEKMQLLSIAAWELTHLKQCSGKVITKSYYQPVSALHTCTGDQIVMLEKSDGSKVMTEVRS